VSGGPLREWLGHTRQAVITLLAVAAGVRLIWWLFTPALPELVSLAVVLTVLGVAVYGRRSK
jgi:hypothetical protein